MFCPKLGILNEGGFTGFVTVIFDVAAGPFIKGFAGALLD